MVRVSFTEYVQRHVQCPPCEVSGRTVHEVLDAVFVNHPQARGYFLDERGKLRTHVTVYINSVAVKDRMALTDPVADDDEVFVMQALSGG